MTDLKKPIKKAVFPVAGLGTRFLPATKVLPKEMLPLVDRPLIQRAVEEAQEAGIEEFIFVSGRGKSLITEHFEIQPELDDLLREKGKLDLLERVSHSDIPSGKVQICMQQRALGLGHAVSCARSLVGDEPFAVFLVDVMTLGEMGCMAQMIKVYNETGGNVIASSPVPRDLTYKYGILDVENEGDDVSAIRGMVEKPDPSDAPSNLHIIGRYILQPEIFDILDRREKGAGGEIQLTDAMVSLMQDQPFTSVKLKGETYDCGHHLGFIEANIAFALADPQFGRETQEILKKYINKENLNAAA
ncbi:MAG: UTP--glucose-1-phosphate uridylyltransferase [Alphaproteobacteria bacterium]|nr:MAG: UTP--glucose-1-phosphate uridylyltransferase [Alphaproteobacteria bacterium]